MMLKGLARTALVLIVIVTASGAALGWFVWREMQQPLAIPEEGIVYEVKEGATLRSLARDLKRQGLLPNPWYFEIWARWVEPGTAIKRGEYFLAEGSTIADLLREFRHGVPVQQLLAASHRVTLFEAQPFAGGMVSATIPVYRTPEEAIAPDLRRLEALGVEIRFGQVAGHDAAEQRPPVLQLGHDAI